MKTPLSTIDYAIMIFYFAVVIFLGFVASKKQTREGFLIADRNLRIFANSTSIVASKVGAGVIMTFVALVYLYGYSVIWYFVGTSAGYFFSSFCRQLKKNVTQPEFLHFGRLLFL